MPFCFIFSRKKNRLEGKRLLSSLTRCVGASEPTTCAKRMYSRRIKFASHLKITSLKEIDKSTFSVSTKYSPKKIKNKCILLYTYKLVEKKMFYFTK